MPSRPTCFDTYIYLYQVGFDKLDELTEELSKEFMRARTLELHELMTMQFELSYFSSETSGTTGEMSVPEIKNWYQMLVERKKEEGKNNSK